MAAFRWSLAAFFAIALVLPLAAFDTLGGDCGDAIQADGTESFTCNTPAFVLMVIALVGPAGLAGSAIWAARDWRAARRLGGRR
jgi:hypothetical protein